jgi:hypothetical protein
LFRQAGFPPSSLENVVTVSKAAGITSVPSCGKEVVQLLRSSAQ